MRSHRAGFSLVELIVVIAVIAALLAISLPAVQQIRQSARNADCKNKLKELAIALQSHQSQFGHLPRDGANGWGYAVYILPEVEQTNLFHQINPSQNPLTLGAMVQPGLTDTVVESYLCPSFSNDPKLPSRYGRLNYLGNSQLLTKKKMQLADVLDGESKTIAFGETTSDYAWAAPATAGGGLSPSAGATFASRHGNGANFVMCDGSVRWISETVDSNVFAALLTIAADDLVGDF